MDKNTIIGLLLITAIIIGFTIYNRPSAEQIEAERLRRDSIAQVDATRAQTEQPPATIPDSSNETLLEQGNNVADFFSTGQTVQSVVSDSLTALTTLPNVQDSALQTTSASEETVVLENEKIRLVLNTLGGSIQSVQLKEHLRYTGDSLYLFEDNEARFNLDLYNRNSVRLSTEQEHFTPIRSADGKSVVMRLQSSPQQYIDFIYTLPADEYMMDFDIRVVGMKNGLHPESLTNFRVNWEQKVRQQEKGRQFEERFSRIHYKYDRQDVQKMSESRNDRKELSEPLKWFAFKDQYFSAIVIGERPFSNTVLTSEMLKDSNYTKEYKAEVWVPGEVSTESDLISAGFQYYFGPVHYNTLKAYDKEIKEGTEKLELEEIVYLGYRWLSWVNKWLVIPVFDFFRSLGWGMGLIILILTLMVKLIISPLTYKSFLSSAKMRVLRPQIQEIEKKFPGKEQDMMMKRQQATMDLYNKVGVSPMSGCLPMLIQMPVLLALFFFFPSAIELRQQSFLWADDLSTYDSLISWSGNIPLITRFVGNHISIFCLLMTVVNVIYTKYNMSSMDTGQQTLPGMKNMPIFMSIFMFFFLNSYPSGLNYYYFLSTLFTIVHTYLMKQFINEDKILAQLEENKKKPKKKPSGFMARLAEAQKMQEKQAREQARANAKRNSRN
ncbi:MAG: membrane protein insertase YidC [Proteiniphilum sp.]|jgi:YidC/Oxa1 family membrane protein insertase|nr:membrane protein insertase YidC [Proteiniphilum sp.]MDD2937422.1 membrane protein insertase YidC [Proteiniphilum sp.]MDD3075233.1 membrane protein insertase YidC [Proteiniphilum sp.]MDD3955156.1 membrane protein insertase YidC [Proteiniphilum sp.]MDD4452068.1 membrane protein insertase YidC [Proteiniphilum sp.]